MGWPNPAQTPPSSTLLAVLIYSNCVIFGLKLVKNAVSNPWKSGSKEGAANYSLRHENFLGDFRNIDSRIHESIDEKFDMALAISEHNELVSSAMTASGAVSGANNRLRGEEDPVDDDRGKD